MATKLNLQLKLLLAGIELLPKKVNNILITGGGYKNIYLMKKLKRKIKNKFYL